MASVVLIQFNSLPIEGDILFLKYGTDAVYEIFYTNRNGANQAKIGTNINNSISNVYQALNTDYNQFNEYSFRFVSTNQLEITHETKTNFFDGATVEGGFGVIVSISNTPPPDPYIITAESYAPNAANPCTKVDLSITTNKQTALARYGGQDINISTNPFTLTIDRGVTTSIELFHSAEKITKSFSPVTQYTITGVEQRLTPNGYSVEIKVSSTGVSTVNIFSILEYSLDDVNWQAPNSFPSLLPGDFTAYVRDTYGCKKQLAFTVVDNSSTVSSEVLPYFELSELNSFHFALQEDSEFENFYNTLSFQESGLNTGDFGHFVKKKDNHTIQFRSSYETHTCTLIDSSNNQINVPVVKKSNNINVFDSREAYVKFYDGNYVGVYFNGGEVYDPVTGDVIGVNTFVKRVPSFYKVGMFIRLSNSLLILDWYQITDIFYDDELKAWVALTNFIATGGNDFGKGKALVNYNQLPYEVYEFYIDFENYEGCYQLNLEVEGFDTSFNYCSERLDVRDDFPKTHEIRYSNTENNEINYQTGITHLLRLPYFEMVQYIPDIEVNSNRTDTKITHLRGKNTDKFSYTFNRIPGPVLQTLTRAIVLDKLFVNGVGYTDPELEVEKLGNTNLYDATVILTPNNEQFVSDSGLRVISNIDTDGYIVTQNGEGFLKHNN